MSWVCFLSAIYIYSVPIYAHVLTPGSNKIHVYSDNSGSCDVGDVVRNEKVECVCASNKIYECSLAVTASNNQASNEDKIHRLGPNECNPRMVYTYDSTICICNSKGKWSHSKCASIFTTLAKKKSCTPNKYVFVGCNVCKCSSEGEIDQEHCTKNDCHQNMQSRRFNTYETVIGSCIQYTWYSMGPCQFCYCMLKNKLICSITKNLTNNLVELGSYNLTVCGQNLLLDVIDLVQDPQAMARIANMLNTMIQNPSSPVGTTINPQFGKNQYGEPLRIGDNQPQLETLDSDDFNNLFKINDNNDGFDLFTTQVASTNNDDYLEALGIPIIRKEPKKKGFQELLQENITGMLNKIWHLAMRKSMVKLDTTSQCEPGASFQKDNCNTCFCLMSGKLLCTDKHCT